jgi:broad specificity phosphatase PhoE
MNELICGLREMRKLQRRIIFVRHGESEGNARGMDNSSLVDLPNHQFSLTERGREQARQVGRALLESGATWDHVFISTYRRTAQTWEQIRLVFEEERGRKSLFASDPTMDARLDEWWRGIWHTMSKDDIAKYYPLEEKIQQREDWYHYRAPGGQSGPDVELQIRSFLNDFFSGVYRDLGTILIIGHGKWEILFWRLMMGATIEEAKERWQTNPFTNCSVTFFSHDSEFAPLEQAGAMLKKKSWW